MKELISIVIPIYNRVHLLPRVLESIKKQTYKNLEIIIVDDGSTENFEFPILNFEKYFPIKYIRQENRGAPVARNRGLEEAKGEYVIFWDADIIGKPEMLEKLKKQLGNSPKASYAYCNHETYIMKQAIKKIPAREFSGDELKKNNYIHSTSLIRRKDAIRWDESLKRFQDWDLWLCMAEQGKTGVWIDRYLFTVLGGGTISGWLPRIAYRAPFRWLPIISSRVRKYNKAKETVFEKHNIS